MVTMSSDTTFLHMVDKGEDIAKSQIQELFAGATVLVTGGTGFIGKLLIEKLLRSCPDLKKVYLLVRPKKNKGVAERLQEQFNDVLYDKLRKENPHFIQKIAIIDGDASLLSLGIKEGDRQKIISEVEIVFHGAASVRLDDPLKISVNINLRGTREILLLAKACANLKALVHISTAYSNCLLPVIEEKIYEPPMFGDCLIKLVESVDEETLKNITSALIGDYPNTYTYAKQCAEDIVWKYSDKVPACIVRPSVVIGTAKEPVAGWIDNIYGPTGVVVGAAVGLLHVLNCRPSANADLVPGDMVVNACIAAAWRTARCRDNLSTVPELPPPPVYNIVSSSQRPLNWDTFMSLNEKYWAEMPPMRAMYSYMFFLIPSKVLYRLSCLLMHWIPAYIVDAIAVLIGKEPMLKATYTKIEKFSGAISYFALREWTFSDGNTRKLFSDLCEADKRMFGFDFSSLDWAEYFYSFSRGLRVYLLKDPLETIPDASMRNYKLQTIHYIICGLLCILGVTLLWWLAGLIF